MPQAERIKETLGWLKIVFGALVAVDVSLVMVVLAVVAGSAFYILLGGLYS